MQLFIIDLEFVNLILFINQTIQRNSQAHHCNTCHQHTEPNKHLIFHQKAKNNEYCQTRKHCSHKQILRVFEVISNFLDVCQRKMVHNFINVLCVDLSWHFVHVGKAISTQYRFCSISVVTN